MTNNSQYQSALRRQSVLESDTNPTFPSMLPYTFWHPTSITSIDLCIRSDGGCMPDKFNSFRKTPSDTWLDEALVNQPVDQSISMRSALSE